jgi:phosphatidylserine decarboxylase
MKIHKEGIKIILISMLLIDGALVAIWMLIPWLWLKLVLTVGLAVFQFLIIWFFRIPNRNFSHREGIVYAPADGKIVVIEKVYEPEYFKDQRIQVSIFMSPLNVHANYYPLSGQVKYVQYHPGKYLVAWHPKSSTENERTTVVIQSGNKEILVRQIAGAVARRIVCYSRQEMAVTSADELGFIKFGSRVDVFLPVNSKILCQLEQVSQGRITEIASL